MLKALKSLLGLAQREDAAVDELAPSVPAAEVELAAARTAQAEAETAYKAALLSSDEAGLHALDAARREASVRVDRAEALLATLRGRLEEAREREAEADRVALYQAARAQADDACRAMVEHYENMASDFVRLVEVIARAEVEIQEANKSLPRGAEPIPSVEHEVRDVPAEADEVLSEVEVQLWVAVGNVRPGTFDQRAVYKTGPGRGVIKTPGLPLSECRQVELRTFTERTVRRGKARKIVYPLAERLALPGLRAGDRDFWRPLSSGTRPGEVIRQVEALRYAQLDAPSAASRPTVAELIPAPGAERVKELEPPPPTQPFRGPYGSELESAE